MDSFRVWISIIKGLLIAGMSFAVILVPFVILALLAIASRRLERQRFLGMDIADIDQMDGEAFEKYLEALFGQQRYAVRRTRYIGDFGADLVLEKDGVKTVVQAKRYKKVVGVKAVQEAVAARGYYGCSEAMVVTNSFYSEQARELARRNDVELWDRRRLLAELRALPAQAEAPSAPAPRHAADFDLLPVIHTPGRPVATCDLCGCQVSEKVEQYCLDHPDRFGGKVYCYPDQKRIRRAA